MSLIKISASCVLLDNFANPPASLTKCSVLSVLFQDPGGLADYIPKEYIPEFLGGTCEVSIHKMVTCYLPHVCPRVLSALPSFMKISLFMM